MNKRDKRTEKMVYADIDLFKLDGMTFEEMTAYIALVHEELPAARQVRVVHEVDWEGGMLGFEGIAAKMPREVEMYDAKSKRSKEAAAKRRATTATV